MTLIKALQVMISLRKQDDPKLPFTTVNIYTIQVDLPYFIPPSLNNSFSPMIALSPNAASDVSNVFMLVPDALPNRLMS